MKNKVALTLLLICLLALVGWTTQRRTQWEYTTTTSTIGKPAELNKLGAEGWELVTVLTDGLSATYFLKRPK